MNSIKKITKELYRRYKLIFNIPENKIDYNYFVLISDYVDWIENNKILKELLYSCKSFEDNKPEYPLIAKRYGKRAKEEFERVKHLLMSEGKRKTAPIRAVSPIVWCLLDEIRTHFEQNPEDFAD